MAPYSALFISEVLCLIFEALAEDKAVLACSAQSCRIFSDVSLDILWRSLVATKPLKDLVPPFKYAGEPGFSGRDDWSRFDEYAKRVHVIGLDEDYHIRLSNYFRDISQASHFLHEVSAIRPGVILFPNLRTLRFIVTGPENFILPVSLRQLDIDITKTILSGPLIQDSYLAAISQMSALESLTFTGFLSSPEILHLTQCKQLRELYLHQARLIRTDDVPCSDAIRELSTLPTLEKLSIPIWLQEQDLSFTAGFCCLKELGVSGDPVMVTEFLRKLSDPNLRAITFHDHYNSRPTCEPGAYRQSLDTLCMLCRSSLRKVVFSVAYGIPEAPLVDVLQPLLQLDLLEHFEIALHRMYIMYPITTYVVQAMASAWPSLRTLRLDTCRSYSNIDNGCRIEALISLARSCPRLVHLEIQVYDRNIPSISDCPHLNHGLEVLKLRTPQGLDLVLLARLLDRIFPTLDLVKVVVDNGGEEDVPGRIVHMFQAIREEARGVACGCSCHSNQSYIKEMQ